MAKGIDGGRPRGGKKNRKYGRNKRFCEVYRREGREDRNRLHKMRRHCRKQPNDRFAHELVKQLKMG